MCVKCVVVVSLLTILLVVYASPPPADVVINSTSPEPFCPGAGSNLTVNYTISPTSGFTADSAKLEILKGTNVLYTDNTIPKTGGTHSATWDGKSGGNYVLPEQYPLTAEVTIIAFGLLIGCSSQVTAKTYEIKLEKVGDVTIESANNYSENTEIKATVLFPSGTPKSGQTVTFYNGTIKFEESGTSIYDGQAGATNLTNGQNVAAASGVATIVLKSVALPKSGTKKPDDAKIKATDPNNAVQQSSTNPIDVDQYVDENGDDTTDWLDAWAGSLLANYQGSGGECGFVTGKCNGIGKDWTSGYGSTAIDTYIIRLNPCATNHRRNVGNELGNTVLHECRHCFQNWETNRTDVGVDNDHDLFEDPNNDDDPTLWGDGDHLPEVVFYALNEDIQDSVDVGTPGSGDDYKDDYSSVGGPAREADATSFAERYD